MTYASADQLAEALRVTVTGDNTPVLEACLDAASAEIAHYLDRTVVLPTPTPSLVERVCVARGVEWWKANDAAFGAIGTQNTGVLNAPTDGFDRHAKNLLPFKQQFGIA